MSDGSGIQWTDATWNPTTGCTKVSPGCAHCYIERTPAFRIKGRKFVNGATDLQLHANRLDQPLHWRKPRRVFVNSLSDLFHADVPDDFIDRVFAVMALSYRHTFQILTKRPERMRAYVQALDDGKGNWYLPRRLWTAYHEFSGRWPTLDDPWPLGNVWLGVSVENQHFADERIPLLLQTPAAVRFISAEPLLGPVNLDNGSHSWLTCTSKLTEDDVEKMESDGVEVPYCCDRFYDGHGGHYHGLDWVIVGGESGPKSRPFDVAWARSIVQQCQAAGVPVFVKQLGRVVHTRNDDGFEGDTPRSWPMDTDTEDSPNGYREEYQGAPVRVRLVDKKGGDMAEWPADVQIRQFPEGVCSSQRSD